MILDNTRTTKARVELVIVKYKDEDIDKEMTST